MRQQQIVVLRVTTGSDPVAPPSEWFWSDLVDDECELIAAGAVSVLPDEDEIDYLALGQTEEEAALLREHDAGEALHLYVARRPGAFQGDAHDLSCRECGDTSEGLMHNNTWRNVEPLMGDVQ